MAARPNGPALVVRVALVLSCLNLWWFMAAGAEDVPVPGWWPWAGVIFTDILAVAAVAVIYAVVVVERRSWLLATIVFVPIGGIFYSVHRFWNLGGRLAARDSVTGVARTGASSPG